MSPLARVFTSSLAVRIVIACVGIALIFAAIGHLKASAGLAKHGQARLESDAVIVTTAIDQLNQALAADCGG